MHFVSFHHFSLLSVNSRLLLVWRDSIIFLFTFLFMLQPEVTLPHKFNFSPSSSFFSLQTPPASPSYHLSRPAHVSVVREVPGIHNFAQYSYNALLCKGILMSPSLQHCSVLVGGVAKIFNSQTHGTPPPLYHFVTAMVLPVFRIHMNLDPIHGCLSTRNFKWIVCII